jgi:catalase
LFPPPSSCTQSPTTPGTATPAASPATAQPSQDSAQQAKSAYQQIQGLLKGMTPENKQKILASLQKELANNSTSSIGGQKLDPNDPADAKMLDMLKKQGKI